MKAQIVSFHCTLKDPLGRVISSSFNNDVLTELPEFRRTSCCHPSDVVTAGYPEFAEPIRGLVEGLQNLKTGEKRRIFVRADRAYGFYDPDLVMEVARKRLPHGESLEMGFQVFTQTRQGEHRVFRVTAANTHSVTLDGNHPLAGQDLFYDVEATSAREATAEELRQGRVTSGADMFH